MDFLVIFYSTLLVCIIITPFWILKFFQEEERLDESKALYTKRKMLLDNLRDLKAEKDSGKYSEAEFNFVSIDIIKELEKIDIELKNKVLPQIIKSVLDHCPNCKSENKVANAKFCAMCGTSLEVYP
jgi:hypothetical protein